MVNTIYEENQTLELKTLKTKHEKNTSQTRE